MLYSKVFKTNKEIFKSAFVNVACEGADPARSEAAFPAYAHQNPLIDWLFWQRLQIAEQLCLRYKNLRVAEPNQSIDLLDFGCGSGVFSHLMQTQGFQVTALDIDLTPHQFLRSSLDFHQNIAWYEGDIKQLVARQDLRPDSFDYICALDVLEHLVDLKQVLVQFKTLLKPNGLLVVSGPTETPLYQLGRKIAGKAFKGDYHLYTIADIKAQTQQLFKIRQCRRLIGFPLTLFEVFSATHD